MSKPKVFVTRDIPDRGLRMVRSFCRAEVWPEETPPARDVLLKRVAGVDGLLCLLTDQVDGAVMDAAGPGLKVISNHAVGVDNVDLDAASRRGIPVGNTPGILTETTADFAFALLLAAARRLVEADRFVREGRWVTWGPKLLLGRDIHGATLGIVGFGRIGQAVAQRAAGFGMRVLYNDTERVEASLEKSIGVQAASLEQLLRESDFVTLHTPLTEATHHLIDAEALERMKSSAILINTARGPVVDNEALYEALQARSIAAAALDVTDPEPLPEGSPLLELDNLVLAPHIASASEATRAKMSQMAAENLIAGLKGERLPFCVNPEVYGGE